MQNINCYIDLKKDSTVNFYYGYLNSGFSFIQTCCQAWLDSVVCNTTSPRAKGEMNSCLFQGDQSEMNPKHFRIPIFHARNDQLTCTSQIPDYFHQIQISLSQNFPENLLKILARYHIPSGRFSTFNQRHDNLPNVFDVLNKKKCTDERKRKITFPN